MLKNDLHEKTWFFDLEWVPDADGARRLLGLAEETTEIEAMQELWKLCGATEENPRPFVKYLFSKVVSISFLSRNIAFLDNEKFVDFRLHSLPKLPVDPSEISESYIINRFLHFVGEKEPHLVGFNSVQSDMQVLIQRSLVNELSARRFCIRPNKPWDGRDYFYRYSEEHLDLLQLFSYDTKMKPTLNELARFCGFPGKLNANGSHVVDLWLNGEITKIIEYNQIDTLNTYLIWLRTVHFCGKISEEDYASEQEQFRGFLEDESQKPDKDYIQNFLDKWEI
ncbi:MAG: 3'-5' exonuclease [Pyrinomonadaceae bacterium]